MKDTCVDGSCKPGSAANCDDGNPCTDASCDPKTGCAQQANTAGCSDNAKCLIGVCKAAKCEVAAAKGCDDNNACTDDSCGDKGCVYTAKKDGAVCQDKDECRAVSVCSTGSCKPGKAEDCDDGNPCTTDGCDPKTGCLWKANKGACDDGNKCTQGDVCSGGACQKGTAIDPKTTCNDGNVCTADTCDPAKGCAHATFASKCDDGDVCTAAEQCNDGQCGGGELVKCIDGKECTIDLCDPKTGACSWGPKKGACDDGLGCTVGDACKAGKCTPTGPKDCADGNPCTADSCDAKTGGCVQAPIVSTKPVQCDDGSKCTKSDTCQNGKCQGGGAPVCNDANACTNDGCDPDSGACVFKPRTGACDNGDKCTFGDSCSNGKCLTGEGLNCDDGSACTKDSCAANSGKCTFAPLADGTGCDDGKKCTSGDACKSGKCTPAKSDCALYDVSFGCGDNASWTFNPTSGHDVRWAVDYSPVPKAIDDAGWGCTLNLNDGFDYCDTSGNGTCLTPTSKASSPVIDGSATAGKLTMTVKTYFDLDEVQSLDRPRIELLDEVGGKVIQTVLLNKGAGQCGGKDCLKTLHDGLKFDVSAANGKKFRLRLSLGSPTTSGNKGKGWFVDRITLEESPPDEICTDGIDNDLDGAKDCADTDCKGLAACVEDCSDGKDNDLDDAVDCKDSDCQGELECADTLASTDIDCGSTAWTLASSSSSVVWAVDATPATIAPYSGKCSLNYNNGKNYCSEATCKDTSANAVGGSATFSKTIDATGYKKLAVVFRSYDGTEHGKDNWQTYDRKWLQVSTAGFKGCSSTATGCSDTAAACKAEGTTSYELKKTDDVMNKWVKQSVDVTAFAGKKFTLRMRFATCDGKYNDYPGWFVDDVRVFGSK